jgi:hypothetical protein
MSSVIFELPKEYAFVAGAAVLTGLLTSVRHFLCRNRPLTLPFQWQSALVGKHRKLAKVPYPNGQCVECFGSQIRT